MKSNKFILFILFIFILSSTGVPQVIHQCNISGERSFDVCASCSTDVHAEGDECCEVEPVTEPSCCETEKPAVAVNPDDASVLTAGEGITCCSDRINLLKIKDDYSISGSQKILDAGFTLIATVSPASAVTGNSSIIAELYNLPPPLFGKDLLFSIHQLKIAAPLS